MSADLLWLTRQLEDAADTATSAALYADAVREFRHGISGLWNDQCARDMSARFLNPAAESQFSAAEMLIHQRGGLASGHARLNEARARGLACGEISREVETFIATASAQGKMLESLSTGISSMLSESEGLLATAMDGCQAADAAGDSAPPEYLYHD